MAAAQSLLLQQPTLQWKSHLFHPPQLFPLRPSVVNFKIRTSLKKHAVKCFLTENNNNGGIGGNDDYSATDQDYIINKFRFPTVESRKTPFEIVAEIIINILKALQKPAAAAVLLGLLLIYDPNSALSATGGRMGGRSFSSRSKTSTTTSSSSHGSPSSSRSSSSSSWGGSSSSSKPSSSWGGSSSSSKPSSSSSSWGGSSSSSKPSSSSSWGGSSSSSRSSSSRSSKKWKSYVDDDDTFFWSSGPSTTRTAPQWQKPSSVDGDYYVGTTSTAAVHSSVGGNSTSTSDSGDVFIAILMVLATVLFVTLVFSPVSSGGSKSCDHFTATDTTSTATDITSVLMLQVGLLGSARSLQKDLDQIAETADTSTTEGLHYILTETVVTLLRHPDYFISSYSSGDVKKNMEEGE